jgi:hypothetical protein
MAHPHFGLASSSLSSRTTTGTIASVAMAALLDGFMRPLLVSADERKPVLRDELLGEVLKSLPQPGDRPFIAATPQAVLAALASLKGPAARLSNTTT